MKRTATNRTALSFGLGALAVVLGGCASTTSSGPWGASIHWASGANLKHAAVQAATDPMTWVPLVGAALLSIGNADNAVSEWAAEKSPLFGNDASPASDTLLDIAKASYLVTALAAPSATLQDKVKGLALGAATIALNNGITQAVKSMAGRDRPNARDDRSFPSGHASNAATAATLGVANLAYLPMPGWANTSLTIGMYSVAGATAWARVEAEEHHLSDVLVGYALGHFVAAFMQQAFFESGLQQPSVTFTPIAQGGAVTVRVAL